MTPQAAEWLQNHPTVAEALQGQEEPAACWVDLEIVDGLPWLRFRREGRQLVCVSAADLHDAVQVQQLTDALTKR